MRIDIMTLFPEMCESVLSESIIGRARKNGYVEINCVNIRDFTLDKHNRVDDAPYGGGMGMLMGPQPIYDCYKSLYGAGEEKPHLIYMSPQGKTLTQQRVKELALTDRIVLLCGHYEGIRMLENVLPNDEAKELESHYNGLLEYPQYTRPYEWHGEKVPDILLSGHHANIDKWRHEKALETTLKKRPELLLDAELSDRDKEYLKSIKK